MQQEQRSKSAGNHEKREDPQAKGKPIWSITGTATAIQIFLLSLFLLWVFIPDYVADRSDAAQVFIESMFSLAIVIVVVVHAMMYYKQAKAMDAQVQQSERAVKAAEDNVATVEKTAIYANRAYITVRIQKSYASHVLDLRIENSGNTPANNVIVSHTCGFEEQPPDGLDADFLHHRQLGLIGPKGFFVIRVGEGTARRPEEAYFPFYCWGRVQYEDIFEKGRRTFFCFRYKMEGLGYATGPCETGNYAD